MRGAGIARQLAAEPQPEPAERARGLAAGEQAEGPAEQGQQVQAEEAGQRPEHVDRALAIAERGEGQSGAAGQGQHQQQGQRQPRTLAPGPLGVEQALAAPQPVGAGENTARQGTALGQRLANRLAVFQRTGLFLAQANGLGQPEGVEAGMRRVTQVTSCVDFPAERESCPANGV